MAGSFRFKQFEVRNEDSALKVGTDAVLLGAAMTVSPDDRRALDIGTGTGVIALMLAQRCPGCRITAIDIDGPSAAEAELNFNASPWAERLTARHCPLSGFVPEGEFDLIFSNPPYYDDSLRNPDAREADARHTGSLSFSEICEFAREHLADDGRLSLVLPAQSENALRRTAASFGLTLFRILRIRTTASKPFARIVAEFARGRRTPVEEELTLQNGASRTPEYAALTSEFYL